MTVVLVAIHGGGQLSATAAFYFNRWQEEKFKPQFGHYCSVTSSTRSDAEQERLLRANYTVVTSGRYAFIWAGQKWRKTGPVTVAPPGSSLHSESRALAVDLGSGVNVEGSAQHEFAEKTLPAYGFAVDQIPGEPWHVQFTLHPTVPAGSGGIPIEETKRRKLNMRFDITRPLWNYQNDDPQNRGGANFYILADTLDQTYRIIEPGSDEERLINEEKARLGYDWNAYNPGVPFPSTENPDRLMAAQVWGKTYAHYTAIATKS